MKIEVTSDGTRVTDAVDLKKFSVVSDLEPSSLGEVLRAREWGSPSDQADHVFVSIEAIRRDTAEQATIDWSSGFEGMLAYASSRGWLSPDGKTILGHIEPRE